MKTRILFSGSLLFILSTLLFTGCSDSLEEQKIEQIERNAVHISETQIKIEEAREEIDEETRKLQADPDKASHLYDGPTIGQYNR